MTEREAYRILGLHPGAGEPEIKRKYRKLMQQAHPDAAAGNPLHDARKLNAAYAFLKKTLSGNTPGLGDGSEGNRRTKFSGRQNFGWDAPVNSSAYREREILQ